MKEELCKAFCNDISVHEVPVGLAIRTPLRRADGDSIGFYVVRHPSQRGLSRLEDDGTTIPYLEACGVDFETQTRAKALSELLQTYGAELDPEELTVQTAYMQEGDLPSAAIGFVALLLRLGDFLLLTQEHVESTFKEDATKRIKDVIGNRAIISEETPVNAHMKEVVPDLTLRAPGRQPVAVFFGQSAPRVQDALFLQMVAMYEAKAPLAVVALLEKENSVGPDLRRRIANRLTAVPVYQGDEDAAIQRIAWEVLGSPASLTTH